MLFFELYFSQAFYRYKISGASGVYQYPLDFHLSNFEGDHQRVSMGLLQRLGGSGIEPHGWSD